MIQLDIVERLQKELKYVNSMVREISGKAMTLSKNGIRVVNGKKTAPRSLADSVQMFSGKVHEHQTALLVLQEKVDHLYDLVTIYNQNEQDNTAD